MIRVFGYLFWRSLRNRWARQLRRLRSPRYIAALLFGATYLWLVLIEQRPRGASTQSAAPAWLELLLTLGVAGAVAWAWIIGVERRVLAFTPAEVSFLFTAPIPRRRLIQYKLLRNQVLILLNTAVWTLILSHERLGVSAWLRALSVWVFLTTLSLHALGASFVRTSLLEHGRFGARRRVVSLAALAAVLSTGGWIVGTAYPELASAWDRGLGGFIRAASAVADRPPAQWFLVPFRVLAQPLLAAGPSEWLTAIGPAIGVLLLHYIWVVRSDTAFEEAAAEASLERARVLAHGGGTPGARLVARALPRFLHLEPIGWAAGAILWKNVVEVIRTQRLRKVLVPMAVAGVVTTLLTVRGAETIANIVGYLALLWAGVMLVMGPQWIRNDLRIDLLKLDVIRSYPVGGAAVVASEVAASTAVLTIIQLGLLLLGYVAFLGTRELADTLAGRTLLFLVAALALPVVNFIGLLLHNGAALFYPGWVHLGPTRVGGVEALGQNMLTMVAFVALLVAVLALPLVLGGAVFLALHPLLGEWALLPATGPFVLTAAFESRMLVLRLGRVFERTEPADVAVQ